MKANDNKQMSRATVNSNSQWLTIFLTHPSSRWRLLSKFRSISTDFPAIIVKNRLFDFIDSTVKLRMPPMKKILIHQSFSLLHPNPISCNSLFSIYDNTILEGFASLTEREYFSFQEAGGLWRSHRSIGEIIE
jgi:hypothetical protein